MNKKLKSIIMASVLLLATACGSQGNSVKTETADRDVDSNRIEPLPETLSIDVLDNCTVSASFSAEDMASSEGVTVLHMTVYDYEKFDLVDISLMQEGDTLVINGADVPLESVIRDEHGLVIINGGIEEGGYELYTDENTIYY